MLIHCSCLCKSTESFAFNRLVLINGCNGKMGKAVAEAAIHAGIQLVPATFSSRAKSGQIVEICGIKIHVHHPSEEEDLLHSVMNDFPEVIMVDYTVPSVVNENAELYCKVGLPFVMGTTGGDRERLYQTVEDAGVYAVISPQMGKQVVAFLAMMNIMSEKCPGVFSGYSLKVKESHQARKADVSGTAKAVIPYFQKMGIKFDVDEIQSIRDPKTQVEVVGVPEEHLGGHAFHAYSLTSPDKTVFFEFQHNICGSSIYADGTIDAAIFLFKKIKSQDGKRIYSMLDVLSEGNMR